MSAFRPVGLAPEKGHKYRKFYVLRDFLAVYQGRIAKKDRLSCDREPQTTRQADPLASYRG